MLHCFEAGGFDLEKVKAPARKRERQQPRRKLRCAACGHTVTDESQRIAVSGSHTHHCTNPAGFTYDIGCFRAAPGCGQVGPQTAEHTWFAGYRWQIAVCGGCGEHLGWRFANSGGDQFYGLILGRLSREQ